MSRLERIALAGLRRLDPERAHRLSLWALRRGLVPSPAARHDPVLMTRVFGLDFENPLGCAAGYDKNAEAIEPLLGLGFGFVEIGSVTPRPQPGNPRPRLFRLRQDRAVVNRLGFNSEGHAAVAARLDTRQRRGVLGINLGKNRDSGDAAADYGAGVARFASLADYLVINVSSPNTPGLRGLQEGPALEALLAAAQAVRARAGSTRPPLLVKLAPDLTAEALRGIAEVALARQVDGLILGNTTLSRPASLASRHRAEAGGLSGRPLFPLALAMVGRLRAAVAGRIPIIGTGGVASGADAYAMIRAGASLVQLYTALVYEGPGLVARILEELAALLRRDGFGHVAEAVGADPMGSP